MGGHLRAVQGHPDFQRRMDCCFSEAAGRYEREARLQQAVARRLARLCGPLPVPAGPQLDLGAGSGFLARALKERRPELDPVLLDRNPSWGGAADPRRRLWDLERGLPGDLRPAALLASSFTLHWLEAPARTLQLWRRSLRPGGLLLLAVPVAGSLQQWHRAAALADVPCTALDLPDATGLLRASDGLRIHRTATVVYTQRADHPGALLRQFRRQGTQASRQASLSAGQWRRLLRFWPVEQGPAALSWRLLLLVAQAGEQHGG
ncbi:methyltransferase domain-containing protein [Synechococcus sp. RSCCF101]|uniref:methyltransferase domain-containing protein n=1 Tax=Synechococcus sp. RSCCF101 TaxID=2511069 RepID=UPI0017842D45|nr:methyltransferase domain-containing protein [Synechococcus sp. RSCCF101]